MPHSDVYKDIAQRTGGDIYIGVVGPVRTGKSTFIKRFMDLMVLPNMEDGFARDRLRDELPQSAAGRSIMTTQPKFVPNEAVEIPLGEARDLRVRLVDCVGYLIPSATGHQEEGGPRMVRTPWFEHDIPFEEAAELGTRKVITEHSTIGFVVTTDGTVTGIPREEYVEAEERVVRELQERGKPFVLLLNTKEPEGETAKKLAAELHERYDCGVYPLDVMQMGAETIGKMMEAVLLEFPIREIRLELPGWLSILGKDHALNKRLLDALKTCLPSLHRMRDQKLLLEAFSGLEGFETPRLGALRLGTGEMEAEIRPLEGTFHQILSEACGFPIRDDAHLIESIRDFAAAKKEYDHIASALRAAYGGGYGMVPPAMEEMVLEEPELMQQGGRYGVKLRARASGLHLIRVDIESELSPLIGSEAQSTEFLNYLKDSFKRDPERVWQTEIFGKPLYDMVRESMTGKVNRLPEGVQNKLQETLQRMVNDGCNGLLCIMI